MDPPRVAINGLMREAAAGPMRGDLEYSSAAIVSSEIVGNAHSSIVDAPLTQVIDGRFAKVISWSDNEWGYSARVEERMVRMSKIDDLAFDSEGQSRPPADESARIA